MPNIMVTDLLVLFVLIAFAIERWTKTLTLVILHFWPEKHVVRGPVHSPHSRQILVPKFLGPDRISLTFVTTAISIASGIAVAYFFKLDMFAQILPEYSMHKSVFLTGIALGGGATPLHELLKYSEYKKQKAKADSKIEQAASL